MTVILAAALAVVLVAAVALAAIARRAVTVARLAAADAGRQLADVEAALAVAPPSGVPGIEGTVAPASGTPVGRSTLAPASGPPSGEAARAAARTPIVESALAPASGPPSSEAALAVAPASGTPIIESALAPSGPPGSAAGEPLPPDGEPSLPAVDEGLPSPGAPDAGVVLAAALWDLERLRQSWADPARIGEGSLRWADRHLGEVLQEEMSRIREETGTPGTLHADLDEPPAAMPSLLLVRGVQMILDLFARHCQGYDLVVERSGRCLRAVVVCDGFDGPTALAGRASSVLSAIRPAGGAVALDRDGDGRLRVAVEVAVAAAG